MADTEQKAPPTIATGGLVMAIVPQNFLEIQRVAAQIITAGVAPLSLVQFPKEGDDEAAIARLGKRNVAAVSTCIMAGAELGLPPMVSLRAFTVINGKPALYADGNVAVVRKAKGSDGKRLAEYLKTGYTEVRDYICPVCKGTFPTADEALTHVILDHAEAFDRLAAVGQPLTDRSFARTAPTDKSFAWCEAKRADNSEVYLATFSIEDARQAGLWEGDKPFKRAKVWRNNTLGWHDDVPNDSPWFRYRQRMLGWRAIGYCLRWLFADVLGGMPDEYEAREIAMVDITPAPRQVTAPESPPVIPPAEPQGVIVDAEAKKPEPLHNPDQPEGAKNEAGADDFNADDSAIATPELTAEDRATLAELEALLAEQVDEPTVEQAFDDFDVQTVFADSEAGLGAAFEIKKRRLHDLARGGTPAELEAAGQGDMFGGNPPEIPRDDGSTDQLVDSLFPGARAP